MRLKKQWIDALGSGSTGAGGGSSKSLNGIVVGSFSASFFFRGFKPAADILSRLQRASSYRTRLPSPIAAFEADAEVD